MDGFRVLTWDTPPDDRADEIPEQFNMATALVDRHLQAGRGDRVAVYYGDQQLTYWDLAALVNRTGNGLRSLGLGLEDRVVLLLPDCPEFLATFLGAMKIGAVPVPVNTLATVDDLGYYLSDSRARAVVLTADCLDRVEAVHPRLRYLRHVVLLGEPRPGTESFAALVDGQSAALEAAPTSRDDVAYWLYSSGTTGRPKGTVHLHEDMVYCTRAYAEHVVGFGEQDISYSASKLFFSYGLVNSLYLPLWSGGAVALNPARPDPTTILETIERYRPTLFFSVPTSYAQVIREIEARAQPPDLSSLRLCISAGEALPPPIYERWRALTGVEVLDGVGSSEIGYIAISNFPGRSRPGTSGELLPGYQARVVDEAGEPVPPGEVGDLWVRSRSTAARYWNQHDRTKQTFVGEWLKTGDKYYVDEAGHYVYAGRSDDMLKVGGIWVSPMEVEAVLLAHEAVAEAAVVGVADEAGLIKPKAYVVTKSGEGGDELAHALQEWVRDRLAHYKYPRIVEFVAELPKTATGKIQRYRLRA
ncbi:MAG TPA: benzoate-CoA ligase family protein [Chloroflexota bacterium]|nr:benzoate-CoA ligase family protein [Chloroflexota bacterium]